MNIAESHDERHLKNELKQLIGSSKLNDVAGLDMSEEMTTYFERVIHILETLSQNSDSFINYLNNEYFMDLPAKAVQTAKSMNSRSSAMNMNNRSSAMNMNNKSNAMNNRAGPTGNNMSVPR